MFPSAYLLTREEMEDKFPDRWLAVTDGIYDGGTPFDSCISAIVVAALTSQEYVKHFSEYDGVYEFERTFPRGKGAQMGTFL